MHTLWVFLLLAIFSACVVNAKVNFKSQRRSHEHIHCFSEQELAESGDRVVQQFVGHKMDWKRYNSVNYVKKLEEAEKSRKRRKRNAQATCPNFDTISKGVTTSERSISPWAYRIDVDENRYPQKLAFAHCLCNHCISTLTGKETSSLNSVLIYQNMLVLRKESCPVENGEKKFIFRLEYLSIPVACTCALPLYN